MATQPSILHVGQKLTQSAASHARPLKRRFFLLMGASTLIASACSSHGQGDEPAALSATTKATTKRIQHAFGETDVPVNPVRIVVLGYFTVEAVIALGVEPIAAPRVIIDNLLHLPPTENEIIDTGAPREPSLEKLATLNPDLILTSRIFTEANTYPLLSQIAPTVVFDVDGTIEWQELNRLCAEVLGKEAEAKQLEADYEAKLQTFKSQLSKDADQIQVSVASFYSERISVFSRETFIGTILEAAGLSRPQRQQEGGTIQISLELLNEMDGDVLFVMKPQSQTELAGDVRAALEKMKTNPLWNNLKVVQTNQVYEVDTYWFGVGYIAANRVLDDLTQYIVKKR